MVQRFFFILSLLLCLTRPASAQFEIGASLGPSISTTNLDPLGREVSALAGIYPELRAGYIFNDWLSASLGVGYCRRGFKERPYGETQKKVSLNYFQMPVYATAFYPLCGKFTVAASMGLQFNVFNSSDAPAPFNIDFQEMHDPVAFLCGAECRYALFKDVCLNLQYRYTADFVYADDNKSLGRLAANYILLGVTYSVPRREKNSSAPVFDVLSEIR